MIWRRSITVRLALVAALLFAVIATTAAVVGIGRLRGELIDELDRSNEARAADLTIQTEFGVEIPFVAVPSDATTVAIIDTDGFLVEATDDLDDEALLDLYLEQPDGEGFDVSFPDVDTIAGGDSMRGVFSTAFAASDGRTYAVFVATSTDTADRSVRLVTNAVLVAIPILTLLVGVLVWLMARRSLRSVERLRSDVASFSGDDLARRVAQPPVDDELGRLARTMNEMLDRIEDASIRQRRFTSDASHELRSPLASIATQLDVDLAHPDLADWPATAHGVRAETTRMQHLVDDLLLLARSGSTAPRRTQQVAIDDLLVDATATVPPRIGVEVRLGEIARTTVPTDPIALRRIVDNLLANAVRHASTLVEVSASGDDATVTIAVDDDGPGVPADQRDAVFERFVRLDDARSRDAGGSGLGLAICRELAAAIGGHVTIGDAAIGGARFVVTVPLAPTE